VKKAEAKRLALFEAYEKARIEKSDAIMARMLADEISRDAARKEMREMRAALLREVYG